MNFLQRRAPRCTAHNDTGWFQHSPPIFFFSNLPTSQHISLLTSPRGRPPLAALKLQQRRQTTAATTTSSSSSNQTYTARRTFPYPALDLYNIIADVSSYSAFLPYCTASTVTSWSSPDAHYGRRWPHLATLSVGYDPGILPGGLSGISESFTSRVFCAPPIAPPAAESEQQEQRQIGIVEAVIGAAEPLMDVQQRRHYEIPHITKQQKDLRLHEANGPIDWLRQQWMVRPRPRHINANGDKTEEETEVGFLLEYKFRHAAYEMLSSAVAPRIAQVMIEVFERRARDLLDTPKAANT